MRDRGNQTGTEVGKQGEINSVEAQLKFWGVGENDGRRNKKKDEQVTVKGICSLNVLKRKDRLAKKMGKETDRGKRTGSGRGYLGGNFGFWKGF